MKTLLPLAQFLVQNVKKADLSLIKNFLSPEELLFFEKIISHKYQTDIQAAQEVFNIKSNTPRYQKIKKQLSDKLYNSLLFITPSIKGIPKEFDEFIEIHKIGAILNVIGYFTRRDLSIPLINQAFNTAYHYFFHNEVLYMANMMRLFYGMTEPNISKYKYYTKIYEETIEHLHWENKSTLYYESINLQFGKNKKVNKELMVVEIGGYLKELTPFENKIRSFKFHRNFYNLNMVFHHIQKQYEDVIFYCDKLLGYIDTIGFPSIVIKRNAIRQKAEHLVLLSRYDEALIEMQNIIILETEGTSSWINAQKMLLLIYLNKQEYAKADVIINDLNNNQSYNRTVSAIKRHIALIGVYLYIFRLMRIIPGYQEDQKSEVKKYMNDYPEFGRDKSSMNIPIIIAQLLEAIVLKREGEVLDRIDALKKYSSRYITKSDSIRSNCFINMLLEVVRNGYHVVAIERHTKKYLAKLLANPKLTSDEAAEVEFIPYEHLWDIIMNYLKNRRLQEARR
jgi:hypothetical protein